LPVTTRVSLMYRCSETTAPESHTNTHKLSLSNTHAHAHAHAHTHTHTHTSLHQVSFDRSRYC
jgi:hypothetical protein